MSSVGRAVPTAGERTTRLRRRVNGLSRRVRSTDYFWFALLLSTVIVLSMLTFLVGEWMTVAVLAVPLLLGSLVLPVGQLVTLAIVVALTAVVDTALALTAGQGLDTHRWADVVAVALLSAVVVISAATRTDLGVPVTRGESMLVDLRDRFRADSTLPALPAGWHAEAAVRSAGGASFAGDFLVTALSEDQRFLEIAVVDVSGKGFAAGTRALSLSGALGGLLGSVPAEQFLPAANTYLLRQRWDEGFATAVHLLLDLSAGTFEVRAAGHPPAVQFHSGSGRWEVHTGEGPVLGLVNRARFSPRHGQLLAGDALLLYTDGLVETAQVDITRGIDALVGQAERLVADGFSGGAEQLVDSVATASDDRALVLVHRR